MGRRVKLLIRLAPLAAAVLAVLLLATCSNAFDIFKAVETEVKVANNKFLLINDISPEKNDEEISQLERIEIEFDRSINPATVNQSSIVFDPPPDPTDVTGTVMKDWTYVYNDTTRTLYIYPDPILNAAPDPNQVQYTVTVTRALKGEDGSDLQDPYSWSFETKESPTGSFYIEALDDSEGQNGSTHDLYTKSTTVQLYIYGTNAYATKMKSGTSEDEVLIPANFASWENTATWYPSTITLPEGSVEGEKAIYMGFGYDLEIDTFPTVNQLKQDSIILDLYAPSVNVGSDRTVNYYTPTPVWLLADAADSASGLDSLLWSRFSGPGSVSFDAPTNDDTTVSITIDGSYVLRLTATDNVDRTSSDDLSLVWDTTRPDPPFFITVGTTPTVTVDKVITWAWNSSGGGNGEFLRSLNSAAWTAVTSPFNYTTKRDGTYTLRVTELDNAGNNSQDPRLYAERSILVTPVIPLDGARNVSLYTDLDWRDYGVLPTTYNVFMKLSTSKYYTQIGKELPESELLNTGTPLLAARTYNWYYVASGKVPYTSPVYSFSTVLK